MKGWDTSEYEEIYKRPKSVPEESPSTWSTTLYLRRFQAGRSGRTSENRIGTDMATGGEPGYVEIYVFTVTCPWIL